MVCANGESGQVGGTDQGSPECQPGAEGGSMESFVADHALLSADPSQDIQSELPELGHHRPQVQCGQGAGAEAVAVVLADYGEGQQIGFLHGLGSATRILYGVSEWGRAQGQ